MDQRSSHLSSTPTRPAPAELEPCLALGGLFQATAQVHRIATIGSADPMQVSVCLSSVLNLNPQNTQEVFGSPSALRHGLEFLKGVLSGKAPHAEPLRLAVAVLQLERRFQRNPRQQQALGRELELLTQTEGVLDHPAAEETVAQLADAWVQHVGSVQPRIMVSGNPQYLKDPDNQSLIRSLLLAGLRASVLWRQVGGSRWRLLWQRKRYIQATQYLLRA